MDELSEEHKGRVIMSFNKPALEWFNLEAELRALLEGLTGASSLGSNHVLEEDE